MKQFTTRYGVRANTIRRWSVTFADYLSEDANPPKGKRRRYSLEDADVIDLVATMRAEDAETGEILNALAAGNRGQWPRDDAGTAEDAAGSTQTELTGKDKMLAELWHRVGVLEGQLKTYIEFHDEWKERAQIAEGKLMLLESGKDDTAPQAAAETPQDDETPAPIADDAPQPETADQTEKKSFWQRLFNR